METKAVKWGTRQYRLQVYLPESIKVALDKYISENFSSDSRIISAVVRKAVAEYLEKRGYLDQQGGEQ